MKASFQLTLDDHDIDGSVATAEFETDEDPALSTLVEMITRTTTAVLMAYDHAKRANLITVQHEPDPAPRRPDPYELRRVG